MQEQLVIWRTKYVNAAINAPLNFRDVEALMICSLDEAQHNQGFLFCFRNINRISLILITLRFIKDTFSA